MSAPMNIQHRRTPSMTCYAPQPTHARSLSGQLATSWSDAFEYVPSFSSSCLIISLTLYASNLTASRHARLSLPHSISALRRLWATCTCPLLPLPLRLRPNCRCLVLPHAETTSHHLSVIMCVSSLHFHSVHFIFCYFGFIHFLLFYSTLWALLYAYLLAPSPRLTLSVWRMNGLGLG